MIPANWKPQATIDGVVTLLLPPHWEVEEAEVDGTTAFGDPGDEHAGALTISVDLYEREQVLDDRELPRILSKRGPRPLRVAEGRYYLREIEEGEEEGERFVEYRWSIVHQTGPKEFAVIAAVYLLGLRETPRSAADFLAQLEAAVLGCEVEPDTEGGDEEEWDEDDAESGD